MQPLVGSAAYHEQRAVGHEPPGGEGVGRIDGFARQAAAVGLVGHRGVGEAVAQHHGPAAQGRRYDLVDQLRAGRLVDEQLGAVGEPGVGRVEHERAQGLAHRGAAGLAQAQHLEPVGAQPLGQKADVGRLAGAVGAFEGHERAHGGP